jgi:hypothetical protein
MQNIFRNDEHPDFYDSGRKVVDDEPVEVIDCTTKSMAYDRAMDNYERTIYGD